MKIDSYTKDDVVVLEPEGKLMLTRDVHELDDNLDSLLAKGQKRVVLDLSKTAWISSAAISVFLDYHAKFNNAGGGLKLANLTPDVREIIALTKLTPVLEICQTLTEALESFGE